jgi:hypothetical protein
MALAINAQANPMTTGGIVNMMIFIFFSSKALSDDEHHFRMEPKDLCSLGLKAIGDV